MPIGSGFGVANETDHIIAVRIAVEARIAEPLRGAGVGARDQQQNTSKDNERQRDDSAAHWTLTSAISARRYSNAPKVITGWR